MSPDRPDADPDEPAPVRPVRRVVPPAELDFATRAHFDAQLSAAQPGEEIVVDCAAVSFMDSSGINALLGALRRQQAQGGDLRVSDPSPVVARLLDITGLERHLGLRGR